MLDWSRTRENSLVRSRKYSRTRRSYNSGFSIVELAVSLTVLLILTAIAIPSLMYSFRTYQLNDAATRVSDMLKFTRYEAVRRNTQECFLIQQSPPNWVLGTDSTCTGTLDTNGRQQVITSFASLLSSGMPSPSAISTALGGTAPTTKYGASISITFDARGAVRVSKGGALAPNAYAFYIGSTTDSEFGYRAVVLVPSGNIQIWTAPAGGAWQQVS
jgi:prepilin-type N-terminal cleavage/methylation domain-containing protein